ncbi:hypothetical protein TSACC_22211 [Terrimicrobium sacchariphilum]|jgi:hypothetical protein|uniref:Lipoprotein n=1 Tax=Terrimicrobium sacchariphilum TaxID=690879 RepID=A0A146G933_TERSA|nr:hypothetical protein [Terrimicrobium sacchariphilum]GAT33793.1 hypothetical protein TSACC_22211 [Terrimicrobium sacchariphilum]
MIARALLALTVLCLTGCVATKPDHPFRAEVSQNASIRWQRADTTLHCEAVFARAVDGQVQVHLFKGTPKPILSLDLAPYGNLTASGKLARFGWSGPFTSAPVPLLGWAHLLRAYQACATWPDGQSELHAPNVRTAITIVSGKPEVISVASELARETITAVFTP